MPPQIIDKLQRQLVKGLVDEAHVVYLMVLIRKSLELSKTKKTDFPWLHLFCNWIVHTGIDGKHGAADWLLGNFDEMVERESKGFTLESLDYLSLSHLREELRSLFAQNNVVSSITDSQEELDHFLEHLSSAISDCPIKYTASATSTKFVKRLTLTKELPNSYVLTLREPFTLWMNWKVELNDGTSRDWPFFN
jgi:hypothetical protein